MIPLRELEIAEPFRSSGPVGRLRHLVEAFRERARGEGLLLKTPRDESAWRRISEMPLAAQQAMLKAFSGFYDIYASAAAEGLGFHDSKKILWRTLHRFGLRWQSDLFERIDENDVIEVYDTSFIQIFRNLRFLELCNYSMEEVLAYEWVDLFRRPDHINDGILQVSQDILSGKIGQTYPMPFGTYVLEEIFSLDRGRFWIEHGIASPLYDSNNRVVGIASTLRATPVESARGTAGTA